MTSSVSTDLKAGFWPLSGGCVSHSPPAAARSKSVGLVRRTGIDRKGRVASTTSGSCEATIIPGVPAYLLRHGSGPTAVAMVLGYHDGHGFPELLPGDASVQTDLVNLAIASQEHYDDYCLPLDAPPDLLPDKSELPEEERHADNCLADHCLTSRSLYGNYYGQTKEADLGPGIEDFVQLRRVAISRSPSPSRLDQVSLDDRSGTRS